MFKMKYLDGTPVDPEYASAVSALVTSAASAEERYGPDELEAHARRLGILAGPRVDLGRAASHASGS